MSDKIAITKLNDYLDNRIDLYICSASFEDRCTVIASHIEKNKIKKALICIIKSEHGDILYESLKQNAKYLSSLFAECSDIELILENPISSTDNMFFALRKYIDSEPHNIVVDITTFTHESLLILIKILSLFKNSNIRLLYNVAKEYSYHTDKIEEKWLSKGIKNIRNVIGYPGKFNPTNKLHLIILVGYEAERSAKLIENYEPTFLSLGWAKKNESTHIAHYELNELKHRKMLRVYSNVNEFTFSCTDPIATKEKIERLIKKYENTNVVIAAMNNKISTVGVALAAMENQYIQLCYASANMYNVNAYSKPSDLCYIYCMSSKEVGLI